MLNSRTCRVVLLTAFGAVAAGGALAPTASAATQRYASPTGGGTVCSSDAPCTIERAVNHAHVGDEVIVRPGDYSLNATLAAPSAITIHGVPGKARPRLLFNGLGQNGIRIVSSSTLRYVQIVQGSGGIALYAGDSLVDQVIAKSAGSNGTAQIQSSTIRNSIVVATGPNGRAITTATNGATCISTYRNVTAMATGQGGVGIRLDVGYAGYGSVSLVNVIARGAATDLHVGTDESGAQATINAYHSNYLTQFKDGPNAAIVDGGGNQAYVPGSDKLFTGYYREPAGAATINAGLNSPFNGAFDVDGDPRQIGLYSDIGADEFVFAPTPITGSATAIARKSATLGGSVNPNGAPTTYRFDYGTTTAYGHSTPTSSAGTNSTAIPASAFVGGLTPGTKYHYRLIATNAGGVTRGLDRTFWTAP